MKACELCKSPARIYCDSDQASLCWTCDSKVHSANFLVARHSRSLLCRVCQSPTPWTASGEKLGPFAVSVCEKCFDDDDEDREESRREIDEDDDVYDGDDDDGENELDVEDEDDDDGDDNQVVPLCTTPPPAASSSSSDEFSTGDKNVLIKRKRENVADLSSEDDVDCISVQKQRREMLTADAIEGNGGTTFYEFLSPNSEEMAGKVREKISGESNKAVVVVGLDLNEC